MSYQFIHVSAYGRNAGAGKAGAHTVDTIAAEAARDRGACPHIRKPRAPEILYGVTPKQAAAASKVWADQAKDSLGRKLRKDGLCLLAGVISLPRDLETGWPTFRGDSLNWLKTEYGERLKSVVEHTDEAHPHLHFYVVPKFGERFSSVHDGYLAAEVLGYDSKKGERNLAYKEAMREYQKKFFLEIGQPFGLQHFGPHRQRLSRAEWKTRKQAALEQAEKNDAVVRFNSSLLEILTDEEHPVIVERLKKHFEERGKERERLRAEKQQAVDKAIERQNQIVVKRGRPR